MPEFYFVNKKLSHLLKDLCPVYLHESCGKKISGRFSIFLNSCDISEVVTLFQTSTNSLLNRQKLLSFLVMNYVYIKIHQCVAVTSLFTNNALLPSDGCLVKHHLRTQIILVEDVTFLKLVFQVVIDILTE